MPTADAILKVISATPRKCATIFKILMENGVMPVELSNVSVSDIDLDKGTLVVRGIKGHSSRASKLKGDTLAMLKEYITRKCSDFINMLRGFSQKMINNGVQEILYLHSDQRRTEDSKMSEKKMVRRNVAIALGIICIILIALIAYFTVTGISAQNSYNHLQNENKQLQTWLDGNESQITDLTNEKNQLQTSLNGNVTSYTFQINSLNSQISNLQSQIGNLLTNATRAVYNVYDSGSFTLGPYGSNDSWTYRDFSIAGYRQVSIYVGFDLNLNVALEIRVGMGDFSGLTHPGGYNWATYYNITTVSGQFISPFTRTIDVRGPQLTVEIYNDENYSIDGVRIVVYATA